MYQVSCWGKFGGYLYTVRYSRTRSHRAGYTSTPQKLFFSRLCGFYLTSPLWNVTASIAWRLSVFLLYLIGDNTRSSIWCKQDSGGIRPPLSSADKVNAFRLMWSTHRLHRKVVSNLSDPRAPHNLIRIGISHHHHIICSDCVKELHHATQILINLVVCSLNISKCLRQIFSAGFFRNEHLWFGFFVTSFNFSALNCKPAQFRLYILGDNNYVWFTTVSLLMCELCEIALCSYNKSLFTTKLLSEKKSMPNLSICPGKSEKSLIFQKKLLSILKTMKKGSGLTCSLC